MPLSRVSLSFSRWLDVAAHRRYEKMLEGGE